MGTKTSDGRGDAYLDERLARYDRWLQEGRIPTSSRVIPVRESLSTQQWVLPGEQVMGILRDASSIALTDCECRTRYKRCDNPIEVCLLIDDAAEAYIAEGQGRRVTLEQAAGELRMANEHGLVHLSIYNPKQQVYAVCSCCSCCCHDLQFLRLYGRDDLIAHSDYVAVTDMDACTHCGDCVDRCVFGARLWENDRVGYDPDACYGCGLCVTICPADATVLRRRGDDEGT